MSKPLDDYIKNKILLYLQKNCNGMANAKTKEDLLVDLDKCYGIALKEREFREYISCIPEIGSHNSLGYFYLMSIDDLRMAQAEAHSRVVAITDRARKQETAFYERQGNQGQLL